MEFSQKIKHSNLRKLLLVIIAGVFLLYSIFYILYSAPRAHAAGISISPLTFEINVNPGDVVTNSLRVHNPTDGSVQINIDVENFAPRGEEGKVTVSEDFGESYSLRDWLILNPSSFTIGPGSTQVIDFTIQVPRNAEPGGHYGSILASVGGGAGAGQLGIAQKIGSLLLVNVAGPVEEKMWVKSMTPVIETAKDTYQDTDFVEYGPIIMRTRFENLGTVHLKPRGYVLLKDMFGREVAREEIPQVNVLPNSIRRVDMEMGQKWMFGKYTADLTAIYGSKNEPLTFSTSFWVIPWTAVTFVGIGLLILLWILIKARKRLKLAFKILFRGG
ncbi:MAG: hypothetical protein R3251_00580 [Candidatus Spechtbacterales bacterium]|nr:hypothetical protein [Candidatus Spechtbacterales bacterium]